jgi:hypothetical protein
METTLLALFLIAAGAWVAYRNIRLMISPDALRAYVQTNPKTASWVQKYGLDEAIRLSRRMLPVGAAVAIGMVVLGSVLLWRSHV